MEFCMARVTVEDCIDEVENSFELVALASLRAKQIQSGSKALVEIDNDKPTVLALREIASKKINIEALRDELVKSEQRLHVYENKEEVVSEEEIKNNLPNADNLSFADYDVDVSLEAEASFAGDNLDVDD